MCYFVIGKASRLLVVTFWETQKLYTIFDCTGVGASKFHAVQESALLGYLPTAEGWFIYIIYK